MLTVTRADKVKVRARRREERRWRAVCSGGRFAYGVPEVDRYVEALQLVDRLTAAAVRHMTEPELDALHESTHAELHEMADGIVFADIPAALDSYWNHGS